MLARFIFAVILTEALTELIIEAQIFEPIKLRLMRIGRFVETLLTCGYCMSVWVGVGVAYLFRLRFGLFDLWWIEPLILGFILHRLANTWHDVLGWIRRKKYPEPPPPP